MSSETLEQRLYPIDQAARYLGISVVQARILTKVKNKIPYVQENKKCKIFIDIADMDEYIKKHKKR